MPRIDELIDRNHRMLNHQAAQVWDIASLRTWIENTACLARDEAAYLSADEDLLCIAMQTDSLLVRLELLLERILIWGWECVGRVSISPPCRHIFRSDCDDSV